MARIFRPTYTVPIPEGAERLERDGRQWVRFRHKGKAVTAPVTTAGKHPGVRVLVEADRWAVEYIDVSGRPRRRSGYTDKRATEALAEELQRAVDRENAGIIDRESVDLSHQLGAPIKTHTDAYRVHLQASGVSAWHLSETMRRLGVIVDGCGFARLADVHAESVQRWCELRATEKMGARTRNTYAGSLRAFIRWCVADRRLATDPLVTLGKADEASDRRRERRAMTEDELRRLNAVAELRPLAEFGRPILKKQEGEQDRKHDTWKRGAMSLDNLAECTVRAEKALQRKPVLIARLKRAGRERALIYRTLVLTGLRRGELAALTWSDLSLDGQAAWLTVSASVAKNGKADSLPIRDDLAADLREWREECGKPVADTRVFSVPKGLVRTLKRDLEAAGIDPVGVDVHSLRHTTATFLAKAGVAPRTAQAILRHSDIRLTFGTYTDPRALHPAGALDALPSFGRRPEFEHMRATGTCDPGRSALGVLLGGTGHFSGHGGARICNEAEGGSPSALDAQRATNSPVSTGIRNHSQQRANGLEPSTFSLEGRR